MLFPLQLPLPYSLPSIDPPAAAHLSRLQDRAQQEAAQRARADERFSEASQALEQERSRLAALKEWAEQEAALRAEAEGQYREAVQRLEEQQSHMAGLQVGGSWRRGEGGEEAREKEAGAARHSGTGDNRPATDLSCSTLSWHAVPCCANPCHAVLQERADAEAALRAQAEQSYREAVQQLEEQQRHMQALQVGGGAGGGGGMAAPRPCLRLQLC